MRSSKVSAIANRIIKKHGAVIDLRKDPEILMDLLRELASDIASGNPCGGVPPSPTGPGPTKAGRVVTNDELMRVLIQISRDLNAVRKALPTTAKRKSR